MGLAGVILDLPAWLVSFSSQAQAVGCYQSVEQRMGLAVELSRQNVQHGTGGPFGAAIFDGVSGELIAAGVNLVLANRCSMLHAEVVAIMLAQQRLGTHDLGAVAGRSFELFSSTEPCAMCLGAVTWSGVSRLVCAARDEDARAVGFDEGVKPEQWIEGYRQRGIEIMQDVCRDPAREVLHDYQDKGGAIYNPSRTADHSD